MSISRSFEHIVTAVAGAVAGVCAALLIGCAKEWIWDAWMKRGDFDPWDAAATTAGGITVAALLTLVRL